jgi:hypothetical protein
MTLPRPTGTAANKPHNDLKTMILQYDFAKPDTVDITITPIRESMMIGRLPYAWAKGLEMNGPTPSKRT